ncbi:MAG: tRNA pseudouridine(13) synthase TruD [Chloroflexota bacterium]
MKIKVRPEDFVVEEITSLRVGRSGPFAVFVLTKEGWNTVDLLRRLSKELAISYSRFSYGGRKDRYGHTVQYVTIDTRGPGYRSGIKVTEKNYSLHPVGFSERQMGPDLIQSNRFEITVRDLTEEESRRSVSEARGAESLGYPNYFDDQRFGSYDQAQGFIAEKLIKRHYNGALKILLTHVHPEDRRQEKERKRFFFDHWGDWTACLEKAKTAFEGDSFAALERDQKAFLPLLQRIPREEMSLFISAYQSFLWNEVLRRIVKRFAKEDAFRYRGVAGDYVFYKTLGERNLIKLRGLVLPTPAANARMPDAFTDSLYRDVLGERKVTPPMFNMRAIRQAFFKSTGRNALVTPGRLAVKTGDDEIYEGRKKLLLTFTSPRGSYGTMLIKRLFCVHYSGPTAG